MQHHATVNWNADYYQRVHNELYNKQCILCPKKWDSHNLEYLVQL